MQQERASVVVWGGHSLPQPGCRLCGLSVGLEPTGGVGSEQGCEPSWAPWAPEGQVALPAGSRAGLSRAHAHSPAPEALVASRGQAPACTRELVGMSV